MVDCNSASKDPVKIAEWIAEGSISDYDGFLEVRFDGKQVKCECVSINHDYIQFKYGGYRLTKWLLGLVGDANWSVEWFNK